MSKTTINLAYTLNYPKKPQTENRCMIADNDFQNYATNEKNVTIVLRFYVVNNIGSLRSNLNLVLRVLMVASKHHETNKGTRSKRPHAFLCFSIFGYPDQTLVLVFYIQHQMLPMVKIS